MRILLITETFLPSTDGVVTRLSEAVRYFNHQGNEVAVIAPDLGVRDCDGVPVYGIKARHMPFYRHRQWGTPSRKVGEIMRDFSPDVVHVANPALIGLSGIYYARKYNLPLVASYHTHLVKYLDYYHLDYKVVRSALWYGERCLHNKADLNLCTSEAMRVELVDHGIKNVHVLRRGVDIMKRHPDFKNEAMRYKLSGGEPEKKLLIFVGRVAAEKELERLLPLMKSRTDLRLAIVGDGPYRKHLMKVFAGTPTVFTGFLHGESLAQAYASADAFIFPSISETLGLVILEAMASGLPVIAACSAPTMEQVREGENGFLFDVTNTDSLHNAVDKLLDDDKIVVIAKNARLEAESYAWSRTSQELLDYYHIAIEQDRKNKFL